MLSSGVLHRMLSKRGVGVGKQHCDSEPGLRQYTDCAANLNCPRSEVHWMLIPAAVRIHPYPTVSLGLHSGISCQHTIVQELASHFASLTNP